MSENLKKKEEKLLASLSDLEAEASGYRQNLQFADLKVAAVKQDLDGVRLNLIDDFLFENIASRFLTYTIKQNNGHTTVAISPQSGGELEFDKMRTSLNWPDMSNIPLFYVLNYIGKGVPFGWKS